MNDCDFVEIYDRKLGKVVARGEPTYFKSNDGRYHFDMDLISFDGKWFFNLKSERFDVKHTNKGPQITFGERDAEQYQWIRWADVRPQMFDLYRDYGYDELDPQVVPLVHELNKWEGIRTIGSCSGHDAHQAWIAMNVEDIISFSIILLPLRSPNMFPNLFGRFRLSLGDDASNGFLKSGIFYFTGMPREKPKVGFFVIATNDVDPNAYRDLNEYAKVLEIIREERLI